MDNGDGGGGKRNFFEWRGRGDSWGREKEREEDKWKAINDNKIIKQTRAVEGCVLRKRGDTCM